MQAYEGNDFNEKLKGINEGLSESFEKLISALERLDGSSHSKKKNWADEAYSRWDAFVRALDRVYAPKATLERNKVISAALDELETCLSASQQDLESEGKGILSPPFSIKRAAFLVLTPTIIVTALYWIATRSPAEATP